VHRIGLSAAAALVIGLTLVAARPAAQQQLMFDIEGIWQYGPVGTTTCVREGLSVTCTLVTPSTTHLFIGRYISPTQIAFHITRRNRMSGCTTFMSATITMLSYSVYSSNWTALDSNCDLRAGQTGVDAAWNRVN